jgi:hypothetical protein
MTTELDPQEVMRRIAKGQSFGKSATLIYDTRSNEMQEVSILQIGSVGLDPCQLSITLVGPRRTPRDFRTADNRLVFADDLSDITNPIIWPPLAAVLEWGVRGTSARVVIDFIDGQTVNVIASYLHVYGASLHGTAPSDIPGTDMATVYLAAIVEPGWISPERRTKTAARVDPGFVEGHVQRTVFVGDVDDRHESDVFGLPKFCKVASLCRVQGAGHLAAVGGIRFFQNPDGTNCVGDFVLSPESCVEVPYKGRYFSVFNHSGHIMKMAVIFKLGLS